MAAYLMGGPAMQERSKVMIQTKKGWPGLPGCGFGVGLTTPPIQNMFCWKVKVKCTLVQALRLCTSRTAHRGSRGIALLFHDHGTRRGWGVSVTHRPLFTPGKDPVPIVQEAEWAPVPVWTDAENLAPTGIRSPDRPARSQSLYRLSYPAHNMKHVTDIYGSSTIDEGHLNP